MKKFSSRIARRFGGGAATLDLSIDVEEELHRRSLARERRIQRQKQKMLAAASADAEALNGQRTVTFDPTKGTNNAFNEMAQMIDATLKSSGTVYVGRGRRRRSWADSSDSEWTESSSCLSSTSDSEDEFMLDPSWKVEDYEIILRKKWAEQRQKQKENSLNRREGALARTAIESVEPNNNKTTLKPESGEKGSLGERAPEASPQLTGLKDKQSSNSSGSSSTENSAIKGLEKKPKKKLHKDKPKEKKKEKEKGKKGAHTPRLTDAGGQQHSQSSHQQPHLSMTLANLSGSHELLRRSEKIDSPYILPASSSDPIDTRRRPKDENSTDEAESDPTITPPQSPSGSNITEAEKQKVAENKLTRVTSFDDEGSEADSETKFVSRQRAASAGSFEDSIQLNPKMSKANKLPLTKLKSDQKHRKGNTEDLEWLKTARKKTKANHNGTLEKDTKEAKKGKKKKRSAGSEIKKRAESSNHNNNNQNEPPDTPHEKNKIVRTGEGEDESRATDASSASSVQKLKSEVHEPRKRSISFDYSASSSSEESTTGSRSPRRTLVSRVQHRDNRSASASPVGRPTDQDSTGSQMAAAVNSGAAASNKESSVATRSRDSNVTWKTLWTTTSNHPHPRGSSARVSPRSPRSPRSPFGTLYTSERCGYESDNSLLKKQLPEEGQALGGKGGPSSGGTSPRDPAAMNESKGLKGDLGKLHTLLSEMKENDIFENLRDSGGTDIQKRNNKGLRSSWSGDGSGPLDLAALRKAAKKKIKHKKENGSDEEDESSSSSSDSEESIHDDDKELKISPFMRIPSKRLTLPPLAVPPLQFNTIAPAEGI